MNRNEFLRIFKNQGSEHIRRMFIELAKSHDIDWSDVENIQFDMFVKDNNKAKWKSKSHFTKMYHNNIKRLVKNEVLTIEELGFVSLLASYMDYEDNSLKSENGEYLSQQDMIDMTGYGKRKIANLIKNLKEHNILYDETLYTDKRKKKYMLDPNLFYKGKEIDVELKKMYHNK